MTFSRAPDAGYSHVRTGLPTLWPNLDNDALAGQSGTTDEYIRSSGTQLRGHFQYFNTRDIFALDDSSNGKAGAGTEEPIMDTRLMWNNVAQCVTEDVVYEKLEKREKRLPHVMGRKICCPFLVSYAGCIMDEFVMRGGEECSASGGPGKGREVQSGR